ncbi:Tenascin-N [Portunus trituberculatus]|uniref:Tenascin-N n=1 Tax=Portunus trituberculatus TaxID=210409 RepID=A0A5B7FWG9_PORTR|nr:Tenascin-N [Portunus trituberculatus]
METDGGGWTVFLKRQQQPYQLDFNRTWEEYQAGFGDPYMEYWLGLEMLHVMTYGRMYSVRLDLETTEQKEEYTTFPNIKVESEDEKYKVILAGREGGSPQTKYCFRYWSYKLFTSIDRDYDSYYRGNCANEQGGGWWYTNCRYFNPTSIYGEHIELTCPYSVQLNVTRLQLKIRPTLCDAPFKAIHLREMSCGSQKGPPWYSGTMRALGSEWSPSARVRILSTAQESLREAREGGELTTASPPSTSRSAKRDNLCDLVLEGTNQQYAPDVACLMLRMLLTLVTCWAQLTEQAAALRWSLRL